MRALRRNLGCLYYLSETFSLNNSAFQARRSMRHTVSAVLFFLIYAILLPTVSRVKRTTRSSKENYPAATRNGPIWITLNATES